MASIFAAGYRKLLNTLNITNLTPPQKAGPATGTGTRSLPFTSLNSLAPQKSYRVTTPHSVSRLQTLLHDQVQVDQNTCQKQTLQVLVKRSWHSAFQVLLRERPLWASLLPVKYANVPQRGLLVPVTDS